MSGLHPPQRFEETARAKGFYSKELIAEIARSGSLQNIKEIPNDVKARFVTAFDISPWDHLQNQAAFQKYTDNSVSKTINLPADARTNDVGRIYHLAYKLKCKGITICRYGSKQDQLLSFGQYTPDARAGEDDPVSADSECSGRPARMHKAYQVAGSLIRQKYSLFHKTIQDVPHLPSLTHEIA